MKSQFFGLSLSLRSIFLIFPSIFTKVRAKFKRRIEKCRSKLKTHLRTKVSGTYIALSEAITEGLKTITAVAADTPKLARALRLWTAFI
ncbi:MAG: hypothetical protein M3384_10580 [Acidobacteriota bacterium]|nr:hypothetical protein [Acidobacteriota bacterium]